LEKFNNKHRDSLSHRTRHSVNPSRNASAPG